MPASLLEVGALVREATAMSRGKNLCHGRNNGEARIGSPVRIGDDARVLELPCQKVSFADSKHVGSYECSGIDCEHIHVEPAPGSQGFWFQAVMG